MAKEVPVADFRDGSSINDHNSISGARLREDSMSQCHHLSKRSSRRRDFNASVIKSHCRGNGRPGKIAAIYLETFTRFAGLPRVSAKER